MVPAPMRDLAANGNSAETEKPAVNDEECFFQAGMVLGNRLRIKRNLHFQAERCSQHRRLGGLSYVHGTCSRAPVRDGPTGVVSGAGRRAAEGRGRIHAFHSFLSFIFYNACMSPLLEMVHSNNSVYMTVFKGLENAKFLFKKRKERKKALKTVV